MKKTSFPWKGKRRSSLSGLPLTIFLCLGFVVSASAQINSATTGKQEFYFENEYLPGPMKVFYYSPQANAPDLPIVILLHGAHRDASAYLDDAIATAKLYNCKVIAPEFDQENFPGLNGYNLGNRKNAKTKKLNKPEEWSFSVLEPLFDTVVKRTLSNNKAYYLYGHSGGAQFGHRFLLYTPQNRVIKAAFANSGWYTALTDVEYPFGLKNADISDESLRAFLGKKVFILLGEADTDRASKDFNATAEADDQGKNRFLRGQYFFKTSRAKAESLQAPFNWTEIFVPGVGHSNGDMSHFAFALFFMDIQ